MKNRNLVKIILVCICLIYSSLSFADAIRYGFNSNSLAANDDGSTGLVSLGFDVNFLGETFSGLYINNNGNITFGQTLSTFTPFDLTTTDRKIIAPHFSDVDTRGTGSVIYGSGTINGKNAFVVTWNGVGYYSNGTDKTNTYQLALIDRSDISVGDFDIEFNYGQIQWEAGSASGGSGGLGGSAARAGYSNGTTNSGTFFELSGSAQNGAFLDGGSKSLVSHKNDESSDLGRYVFEARNGIIGEDDDDLLLMVVPAIAASANKLRFATTNDNNSNSPTTSFMANKRNLSNPTDQFSGYDKTLPIIVSGDQIVVDLQNYLNKPSYRKWVEGKVRFRTEGIGVGSRLTLRAPLQNEDKIKAHKVTAYRTDEPTNTDKIVLVLVPKSTEDKFNDWYTRESGDTGWMASLPLPYESVLRYPDGGFSDPEPSSCSPQYWHNPDYIYAFNFPAWKVGSTYYHPGCHLDVRSRQTQTGTHGHQACYDENFDLITEGVGSGTADRGYPFRIDSQTCFEGYQCHKQTDVRPFIWAMHLDGNPVNPLENYSDLMGPLIVDNAKNMKKYLSVRPALLDLSSPTISRGSCQ